MSVAGLRIRRAEERDLPRIVELIHLGAVPASREELGPPLPPAYSDAFAAIDASPNDDLLVAEVAGEVVATMQLTVMPGIAGRGRPIAQLESVHVAEAHRGGGIGEELVHWAVARAREHGCWRLQLSSNTARTRAHAFYRRLGFVDSHTGFKLDLG